MRIYVQLNDWVKIEAGMVRICVYVDDAMFSTVVLTLFSLQRARSSIYAGFYDVGKMLLRGSGSDERRTR